MKTTRDNPGAFKKPPNIKFLKLIKKSIRCAMENNILIAHKVFLSGILNIYYQSRKQNRFYCNLCREDIPAFLYTVSKNKILRNSICPNCSSRKRHRGLLEIYKSILKNYKQPKILHFAPEPVYHSLFKSYDYKTADLMLKDVELSIDIQKTNLNEGSFDIIICNHVLEHVKDDQKAMEEIARILSHSGCLIITIPGDWNRSETVEFNELDGNGHYREYGLEVIDVLNYYFDMVETIDIIKFEYFYHLPLGLTNKHDLVFICQKK